jgi:lipopolysaccharide/colanic/teichoic acid biosynthesis glycosyltransferase
VEGDADVLRIIAMRRELFARRFAAVPDSLAMDKLIDRERARMFRTGAEFSLILFRAKRTGNVRFTHRLAKVVRTRARASDEFGWFDDDHLCLLLPDTGSSGAWRLANDICALLVGKAPRPLFAVYTAASTGLKGGATGGPVELTHVPPSAVGENGNGNSNGKSHGSGGDNGHAAVSHVLQLERSHRADTGKRNANRNGDDDADGHDHNGDDNANGGNGHGATSEGRGTNGEHRDVPPPIPAFRPTELLPRLLMGREPADANQPVEQIEGLLVRTLPPWKRSVDICGAAIGLVLTSPLLLVIAVAIRMTSKGPALFCQQRAGLGGAPFVIYKFRTMVVDAERNKRELRRQSEQDGPAFKLRVDPRVTRLGRLLRATSLDELPQLWNVLLGNMSLVGPRPLPMEEHDECESWHRVRLDVTPGITGVWQVRGRSRVSFAEWMRMDIGYIRRRSFWTDLRILVATVPAVVLRRGAH